MSLFSIIAFNIVKFIKLKYKALLNLLKVFFNIANLFISFFNFNSFLFLKNSLKLPISSLLLKIRANIKEQLVFKHLILYLKAFLRCYQKSTIKNEILSSPIFSVKTKLKTMLRPYSQHLNKI